ncbi:TlpA family protein disulfide reductase [Hymenobacter sp. RP-2-7]|uniref:TlpA family protein disulfide reductase n=1 Tax=Hymenobacter polaris TaxID=2682546 RepID=A0A7Y0AGY0_9BACT|nr:TlpA disulfide reductase family protein [Hymenobacter polaris]NML66920.1 TlpA family protein disulfide reductase [Hymenobacter polaris]
MKIILIALALAGSLAARAQAPATLNGQLPGCADSTTVAVFEPAPDGRFNFFFTDGPNEARVHSGRFSYALHQPAAGIVRLASSCANLLLYTEPGAAIGFSSTATPDAAKRVYTFSGPNAAANDLLANHQLLNAGPATSNRVGRILETAPTAAAGLTQLQDSLLRPALAPLVRLHRQGRTSKACYHYLRAYTEQNVVFFAAGILAGYLKDSVRTNLHPAMHPAGARQLLASIMARYDPAQPRYQMAGNDLEKYVLIERGVLPGAAPTERTWQPFAAQFAPVNSAFEAYDYAPPAVQQGAVGNTLLTALALNAMSLSEFAAVFATYVQKFPASPYVPLVVHYLRGEAERTAKANAAKAAAATLGAPAAGPANVLFGQLAEGQRALTFGAAPGLDTVRTLGGLVRSQRPGRAVFVDLWASWCGPCLEEFKHEPELHKFLTDNNVDILYVALDQPGFRDKWTALAASYRLRGYHYLAPPALQKALVPIVPYIPRYMLFDKTGRLVEASAYRPSEGDQLRQQVVERLK